MARLNFNQLTRSINYIKERIKITKGLSTKLPNLYLRTILSGLIDFPKADVWLKAIRTLTF